MQGMIRAGADDQRRGDADVVVDDDRRLRRWRGCNDRPLLGVEITLSWPAGRVGVPARLRCGCGRLIRGVLYVINQRRGES